MKTYINLIDVKDNNGKSARKLRIELSDKQSRLLARLHRKWENGKDGNAFRQAVVSFADIFAKERGIKSYSALSVSR